MLIAFLTLLLGCIVILAIIAANGFFVAQEFAFMSVDRARLRARAEAGDTAAEGALRITRRTSFMLSGAQLGITVTGLLVGYVAEPLVGNSLGTIFGVVGVPPAVSISVGTVLALVLSTITQMIFGELYPKNLAIASPERLARVLTRPTRIYLALFGWLITIFDHAANILLRALKIEPLDDVDQSTNVRDLEHIVNDSRSSGDLSEDMSLILDRIIDFPRRDIEHAKIPRNRVDIVHPTTTVGDIRRVMATAHTRYPVVDDETPIGVVHLLDVLQTPPDSSPTATDLMREATVIPTFMPLPSALARLQADGAELACVVDEHGTFDGILTLEDLSEEITGELADEHDEAPTDGITPIADRAWNVAGDVHLDELERVLGHRLPEGDYETLAGLLIAEYEDLPQPGDVIRVRLPQQTVDALEDEPPSRFLETTVIDIDSHVPSTTVVRLRDERGDKS